MQKQLRESLSEEFPFMRRGLSAGEQEKQWGGVRDSYGAFGLEIGDGWYQTIRDMCTEITAAYEAEGKIVDVVMDRVKQKCGTLRVYYHLEGENAVLHVPNRLTDSSRPRVRPGSSDLHRKVAEIVGNCEEKSAHICEVCGKPGSPRKDLRWVSTLCDEHYQHCIENVRGGKIWCLHCFLDSFRYDTLIRLLDEERHTLYENTVGEITQRIMNQRIVLSAYVERDQLIVITTLDEA